MISRRLIAFGVILAVPSCAPVTRSTKAQGNAVVFTKKAPPVGDRIASAFNVDLQAKMSMLQQGTVLGTRTLHLHVATRYVLTELPRPSASTRVQTVRYLESTITSTEDGKSAGVPPNPVAGKSYRVTTTGDQVDVTDLNGGAVPKAESDEVQGDLGDIELGKEFDDWLVAHPFAPGESARAPLELVPSSFRFGPGAPAHPVLTLKAVRSDPTRRVAVFGVSIDVSGMGKNGLQLNMPMRGTLEVEVDTCRLVSVQIDGPVEMIGTKQKDGQPVEIRTTGTLSFGGSTTPQPGYDVNR